MLVAIENVDIRKCLRQFEDCGGVLRFFVFQGGSGPDEIESHRLVAFESLRSVIAERYEWDRRKWEEMKRRNHVDQIAVRIGRKAKQKGISVDTQVSTERLMSNYQTPRLASVDESVLENCVPERLSVDRFLHGSNGKGFINAFFHPPDGIRYSKEAPIPSLGNNLASEGERLFETLKDRLFGEMTSLSIYRWPTICSDYFELEDDYLWGNFFWTIHAPQYDWYVGVVAAEMID